MGKTDTKQRHKPRSVLADSVVVAPNRLVVIPQDQRWSGRRILRRPGRRRRWLPPLAYSCLPLTFANQHGFIVRSEYAVSLLWDGTDDPDGLTVRLLATQPVVDGGTLVYWSRFGAGILTIQPRFTFRTPPGINLLVKAPPNYPIDGIHWVEAIVETDNLRRDFTFNLRVTRPDVTIVIPRGAPIGCLLPYPRYMFDRFRPTELRDPDQLAEARLTSREFQVDREQFAPDRPNHIYTSGTDIYGLQFNEHQWTLDGGQAWRRKRRRSQQSTKTPLPTEEQERRN